MAVLAVGVQYDITFETAGQYSVWVNVIAGNDRHNNLKAGTFAFGTAIATVNAAIAAFVKSYAAANMGVVFGVGDVAAYANPISAVLTP